MKLIDLVKSYDKRLVAPLIGYPGIKLTGTTAIENLTDASKQVETIMALADIYDMDIVFTIMDLAVEAEALGIPIEFHKNESPNVTVHPLQNAEQIKNYKIPDPYKDGRLNVFIKTVEMLKKKSDKIIGGYVIGPFTLAGLMMGAENLALNSIIEPDFCSAAIDFAAGVSLEYAKALEKAGADFIVLLDPTAVLMSPKLYDQFITPSINKITRMISVPVVLHTCGDTTKLVPNMCNTGVQGLSLDGVVDFAKLSKTVPEDIVLIGNIDPVRVMMDTHAEVVYDETAKLLTDMNDIPNFILSTGCDLPTQMPMDNMKAFCKAAMDYNRK